MVLVYSDAPAPPDPVLFPELLLVYSIDQWFHCWDVCVHCSISQHHFIIWWVSDSIGLWRITLPPLYCILPSLFTQCLHHRTPWGAYFRRQVLIIGVLDVSPHGLGGPHGPSSLPFWFLILRAYIPRPRRLFHTFCITILRYLPWKW